MTDFVEDKPAKAAASGRSTALFPDDRGDMPLETRRALVQLMRGPTVDGQRHTLLWKALVRDENLIRARLHEMFLDLVIDREHMVAFTRQADVAELDAPMLLRRQPLTFLESAVLLQLRMNLASADAQGERCVIERAALMEHLTVYGAGESDPVKFAKQCDAAIEKTQRLGLTTKLRGDEQRLEVSPALKLIFTVSEIEALTDAYRALATPGQTQPAPAGDQAATHPDGGADAE